MPPLAFQETTTQTAAVTNNPQVSEVQLYQFCGDILLRKMIDMSQILEGVGVVVHMDETALVKRKHNRGRMTANQQLVLRFYDAMSLKGYIETTSNSSADVLLPIN